MIKLNLLSQKKPGKAKAKPSLWVGQFSKPAARVAIGGSQESIQPPAFDHTPLADAVQGRGLTGAGAVGFAALASTMLPANGRSRRVHR